MSRDDFVITTVLEAPAQAVYDAVATRAGVAGWWTRFVTYGERPGALAEMQFPDAGFFAKFEILELDRPRRVAWRCIESRHPESSGFSDLEEWNGTEICFEIEAVEAARSRLGFTHAGLVPRLECNDSCRSIWSFYIGTSLRGLVEQGSGEPYGA